ncbi:hypothetical protein, partial, partial [Parasitella parasitica]
PTPLTSRADGTSASQWATVAATQPAAPASNVQRPTVQQRPRTAKKPSTKRAPPTLATIARFYSSPSETHGFQFLYFKTRGRDPISKVRKGFPVLDIQNNRILDIHYPDNHHVGFLIHNDYAQHVIDAMAKASTAVVTDFDPTSPALLRDPKYADKTDMNFLQAEATRIHQE